MRDKFARAQIALHWLTFLLVVTAYATIELRGLHSADPGRVMP